MSIALVLSFIEIILGLEFSYDDRHQPHTSLLWQPQCYVNNFFVLSFIEVIFGRSFLRMIGISHIPHCYGNLVTMATTVLCE